MRVTTTLLLLPALTLAQEQKPLGAFIDIANSWFDKAKSYIPSSFDTPTGTVAAKVAAKNVVPLTADNWASVLQPSASATATSGPDNWMVLISGGNKTCFGLCGNVEHAWNESAALFAVDPKAPHLGYVDCDTNNILCSMWAASPAAIYYIQLPIPAADQSKPATTIHIVPLNTTAITALDIMQIHTKKTYEKQPAYEGPFHPFDGYIVKYGLSQPIGYAMYIFGLIPSWTFMILISFVTRTFM